MKNNFTEFLPFNNDQKAIKVLFQSNAKVIGLAFKEKQVLERHTTNTPAFLFVISGSIDFLIDNKTYTLKDSDFLEIPAMVEHEVRANMDSRLLLVK